MLEPKNNAQLKATAVAATLEMHGPSRSLWLDGWYRLVRNRAPVVGMIVIVLFFLVAIFANVLAPYNPLQLNSGNDFLSPSFITKDAAKRAGDPAFFLGTDTLGRDLLSRVIYGALVSMVVGLVPTLIVVLVGTSPIIILAALRVPGFIITEAVLGYLGLGMRPTTNPSAFFITSWGSLLLDGQTAINAQPWMLLAPAFGIGLVVLAFTFVGDGLRDAFDPRMRGNS